jgi:hypothetical protein
LPKSSTYANAVRGGSGRRSVTGPVELRRSSGLAAVIRRRRRLRSPATQIRRARTTAPRPRNQAHRSARIGNASDVGKKERNRERGEPWLPSTYLREPARRKGSRNQGVSVLFILSPVDRPGGTSLDASHRCPTISVTLERGPFSYTGPHVQCLSSGREWWATFSEEESDVHFSQQRRTARPNAMSHRPLSCCTVKPIPDRQRPPPSAHRTSAQQGAHALTVCSACCKPITGRQQPLPSARLESR